MYHQFTNFVLTAEEDEEGSLTIRIQSADESRIIKLDDSLYRDKGFVKPDHMLFVADFVTEKMISSLYPKRTNQIG